MTNNLEKYFIVPANVAENHIIPHAKQPYNVWSQKSLLIGHPNLTFIQLIREECRKQCNNYRISAHPKSSSLHSSGLNLWCKVKCPHDSDIVLTCLKSEFNANSDIRFNIDNSSCAECSKGN